MKLIKINEDHYVIVDDSEILPDVFIYDFLQKQVKKHSGTYGHLKYIQDNCKKITHSTEPLEEFTDNEGIRRIGWTKIKSVELSEVEEAIYGWNVEKIGRDRAVERRWDTNSMDTRRVGNEFVEAVKFGFRAAMELVKDKVFTVEDVVKKIESMEELNLPNGAKGAI